MSCDRFQEELLSLVSAQEQLVKIMQLILENALADNDDPPEPKWSLSFAP